MDNVGERLSSFVLDVIRGICDEILDIGIDNLFRYTIRSTVMLKETND